MDLERSCNAFDSHRSANWELSGRSRLELHRAHDPQLTRLADAIAQRVGPQRFHVWFNNSTRLHLKQEGLEIAVPNDFISEWIGSHFSKPIQDAAHEVLGCPLTVKFSVMPQLFEIDPADPDYSEHEGKDSAAVPIRSVASLTALRRNSTPARVGAAAIAVESVSAAGASDTIYKSLPKLGLRFAAA